MAEPPPLPDSGVGECARSDSPEVPGCLVTTARLCLRRITAGDLDAMFAVYSDPLGMRWVGDGQPITREACEQWLEVTRRNEASRGYGMVAMQAREGGEVIGFCGLVHPGGQAMPELKYALLRRVWGQGFATEAADALLRHGCTALGVHAAIATTAPENTASHRVLAKVGMRRGVLRRNDDGSFTQAFTWRCGCGLQSSKPT